MSWVYTFFPILFQTSYSHPCVKRRWEKERLKWVSSLQNSAVVILSCCRKEWSSFFQPWLCFQFLKDSNGICIKKSSWYKTLENLKEHTLITLLGIAVHVIYGCFISSPVMGEWSLCSHRILLSTWPIHKGYWIPRQNTPVGIIPPVSWRKVIANLWNLIILFLR